MSNDYYNHGGYPSTGAVGSSASMRAELDAVTVGFGKLPTLTANALKLVRVNAGATALEATSLIDGITIGSVTPAPGTFTTLGSTGLATLASLTVTGATNLNGAVALGDAQADTITIGGAAWKSGTGAFTFPAPASGDTITSTSVASYYAGNFIGGGGAGVNFGVNIKAGTNATDYALRLQDAAANQIAQFYGDRHWVIGNNGSANTLAGSTAGNVTLGTATSGVGLTVNAPAGGGAAIDALATVHTTGQFDNGGQSGTLTGLVLGGLGSNYGRLLETGNDAWALGKSGTRTGAVTNIISWIAAGNVTIGPPSSGVHQFSGDYRFVNNVFIGQAGGGAFGLLNINHSGAQNSALTLGDQVTPSSQTGIYLRQTSGTAGIATSGASLALKTSAPAGADMILLNSAGNVTIAAPSSGAPLTVYGSGSLFYSNAAGTLSHINVGRTSSEARVAVAANTNDFLAGAAVGDAIFYHVGGARAIFGTAGAQAAEIWSNSTQRIVVGSSGNVTIAAPGSGTALAVDGTTTVASGTATPAGGTAGKGLTFGTTSNFGVFYGSGAPSLSAAKGSLYLRSDGSGTTNRVYVNTNGTTTWTALTTVA